MFRGLADMVDGEKIIPFVRQFYDSPSTFLWEDDTGDVRRVRQGEGGEQGDPLMPVGQHRAMVVVQAQLKEGESLFAYLDDIMSSEIEDKHQHPPGKDEVVECSNVQAGHGRHVDS